MNTNDNLELIDFLNKEGYYNIVQTPNKGVCALYRFAFTVGLVININSIGYEGRYCYNNNSDAKTAIQSWDGNGDPSGPWIKYKGKGGERSNKIKNNENRN